MLSSPTILKFIKMDGFFMNIVIRQLFLLLMSLSYFTAYANDDFITFKEPREDQEEQTLLQASEEGLFCKDFLKNGGVRGKHKLKAAGATAGMWGATIAGTILTLPTIIGPILIGEIGGVMSIASTAGTSDLFYQSRQNTKLGNSIEDAYTHLGAIKPGKNELQSLKRFDHFYNKFISHYPTTEVSKNEFAEGIVRANEAGWFCSLSTFEKDPSPTELAKLRKQYEKHQINLNTGKAKAGETRRSITLFKVVFPNGISAAPSDKEILEFQSRNEVINAVNDAAAKIRNEKNRVNESPLSENS